MTRTFLFCALASLFIVTAPQASFAAAPQMQPLDNDALAATSGGSESAITSVVTDNSIGNVGATGGVANVSAIGNNGLTTMIENTGNQVSISTSTVVNVNFH